MSLTNLKKGDKVILHLFTGIAVNCTEIVSCDNKSITIAKKDGTKAKFSRKTGKQTDPEAKNARFANYITEDDGSFDPSKTGRKPKDKKVEKAPAKKVRTRKAKVEPEDIDEDEYTEEEPAPKKKAAKKSTSKKKSEPEDEDDFEEEE